MTITDGSGRLQLVFFGNGVHKPHKDLLPGTRAMFSGKVSVFNHRDLPASPHPAYEPLRADSDDAAETVDSWAGALIPIYPATAKLESWKIAKCPSDGAAQRQEAVDPLPDSLRDGRGPGLPAEALVKIHRPHTKADIHDARARLKWDEAFVLQVALARRRHADAQLPAVARLPKPNRLLGARLRRQAALHPHRGPAEGLQGDLRRPRHRAPHAPAAPGRGRFREDDGRPARHARRRRRGQAAMLAPTEVLAQQHHRSITEMMGELAEGGMLGSRALHQGRAAHRFHGGGGAAAGAARPRHR